MEKVYYRSPIGAVEITGTQEGIESISLLDADMTTSESIPAFLSDAFLQIGQYFSGTLKSFDLKLNPKGTEFQKKVWAELMEIPYGKTKSYMAVAVKLGDPKSIRAVGTANGRNPIAIVVPCHRVIGSNGDLTGYAGGLWRKKWLLEHEGVLGKDTQGSLF